MAVPTLTVITPSTGSTVGRNQIELTGTNFRTAPSPPPVTYTSNDEQQTVGVWVNGVRCASAFASGSTSAVAEVPEWRGPHDAATPCSVDVTIANLDDAGVIIAGETVTLVDGYSYDRPSLVAVTPFQRVIEETIALFRRHVLPNTNWIKSRDYDDSTTDHLDSAQRATLPLINLVGPTLVEAKDWGRVRADTEDISATEWQRRQRQKTVHLEWILDGYTSDASDNEAINLSVAVTDFFTIVKVVRIPKDPAYPDGTQWEHELEMEPDGAPAFDVAPQSDGLRHFRCEFVVRGVDIGAQDLPVVESGWTAYDATVPEVDPKGL